MRFWDFSMGLCMGFSGLSGVYRINRFLFSGNIGKYWDYVWESYGITGIIWDYVWVWDNRY